MDINVLSVVLILTYISIAIYTYGLSFSGLQGFFELIAEEDYYKDMLFSIASGIFWPVTLPIYLSCGGDVIKIFKTKPKFW